MNLYERLTDEMKLALNNERINFPLVVDVVEKDLNSTNDVYQMKFGTFDTLRDIAQNQLDWSYSDSGWIYKYFKQ